MATPRDAQLALRQLCNAIPENIRPQFLEQERFIDTMLLQVNDLLQSMRPVQSAISDITDLQPHKGS